MIVQTVSASVYASALVDSEASVRRHIGYKIWAVLHDSTKDYLRRAESHYQNELTLDPARQNFADSLLNFSNAMLAELATRFWHVVHADDRSRAEARNFLGRNGEPEWGEWIKLLAEIGQGGRRSITNVALAKRIRVQDLVGLRSEFEEVRKRGRNKAAHRRRIRKQAANDLYDNLMRQGLARKTFAALHGI